MKPHPGSVGKRDPRKVWIYENILGAWSSDRPEWPDSLNGTITYRFADEIDLLMFTLKWSGDA